MGARPVVLRHQRLPHPRGISGSLRLDQVVTWVFGPLQPPHATFSLGIKEEISQYEEEYLYQMRR